MSEWELFKSYLDYVKSHYDSMETWEDNDKLQEAIYSIEKEICILNSYFICIRREEIRYEPVSYLSNRCRL